MQSSGGKSGICSHLGGNDCSCSFLLNKDVLWKGPPMLRSSRHCTRDVSVVKIKEVHLNMLDAGLQAPPGFVELSIIVFYFRKKRGNWVYHSHPPQMPMTGMQCGGMEIHQVLLGYVVFLDTRRIVSSQPCPIGKGCVCCYGPQSVKSESPPNLWKAKFCHPAPKRRPNTLQQE